MEWEETRDGFVIIRTTTSGTTDIIEYLESLDSVSSATASNPGGKIAIWVEDISSACVFHYLSFAQETVWDAQSCDEHWDQKGAFLYSTGRVDRKVKVCRTSRWELMEL